MASFEHLPRSMTHPVVCPARGQDVLVKPRYNKGSAFTDDERLKFGLEGMLPANIQTLDEQVARAYQQYSERPDALAKNVFLASMKEQNEVLYYKLLLGHLKEMMSVVYTPTEGDAIQNFSRIFRRPDGCFLSIRNSEPDAIEKALSNFSSTGEIPDESIDVIVVTDGEEILGIGDQGAGGELISVAKLALIVLCAGIHPARSIPVALDCGTDNPDLLKDELYLGLKEKRVRGEEYDTFIDRFVNVAREAFPRAYIHFEDFGLSNANRILEKYRSKIPCFNDDIQGTGCVTLAAMMAGLKIAGVKLGDARMVVFGSGSAGMGIANQVRDAIASDIGKSPEEAAQQIWCIDKPGLLLESQGDSLTSAQRPFARPASESWPSSGNDLLSVIKKVKPHVLIGTSTVPGAFTEDVVREMHKHAPRPVIFPLSNPTRLHEAKPQDLMTWTDGKALVATGSPFPPVKLSDGAEVEVAECNNLFVFPSICLGAVLSRASKVTDRMLVAVVKTISALAPALKDERKGLLPDVSEVREVSELIAVAVIKEAVKEGVAREQGIPDENAGEETLRYWVRAQMWRPEYRDMITQSEAAKE